MPRDGAEPPDLRDSDHDGSAPAVGTDRPPDLCPSSKRAWIAASPWQDQTLPSFPRRGRQTPGDAMWRCGDTMALAYSEKGTPRTRNRPVEAANSQATDPSVLRGVKQIAQHSAVQDDALLSIASNDPASVFNGMQKIA